VEALGLFQVQRKTGVLGEVAELLPVLLQLEKLVKQTQGLAAAVHLAAMDLN
jgi:hypothetical protein